MARKDRLRALCGVVASMSGGVSGANKWMITRLVQRVAAARAAAMQEGAASAEMLCWDGPMRSISFESAVRKVICLSCSARGLIYSDEV
jgi:hypothetical protein